MDELHSCINAFTKAFNTPNFNFSAPGLPNGSIRNMRLHMSFSLALSVAGRSLQEHLKHGGRTILRVAALRLAARDTCCHHQDRVLLDSHRLN
eukprot:TRINITY_DN8212_c0_g1_i3.p2 TRINITY_DN8212_c0_g1~~TRINITY_DN8212_c0_g1_i3.p2  ORF type:complete len:103 (-),score=5.83 TRINITY_DN8212_c0_g1_i3:519-797(-)